MMMICRSTCSLRVAVWGGIIEGRSRGCYPLLLGSGGGMFLMSSGGGFPSNFFPHRVGSFLKVGIWGD
jgi:hypothetical protein